MTSPLNPGTQHSSEVVYSLGMFDIRHDQIVSGDTDLLNRET